MSNQVYANGMEFACKAAQGKSICAFPDVCLSPPSPPAGPIPIPYPNTGMASDTTDGSKTVKISDEEVLLKDKSYFKKSTGDEAATKGLGMGVVTAQIQGKVYFKAWSMDVKAEGENVVRHLDLTTHNHMSDPGNSPPWIYADDQCTKAIPGCEDEVAAAQTACSGKTTQKQQCKDAGCREAKRCLLVSYNQGKRDSAATQVGCCDGEQPHHLVEAHCFYERGARGEAGSLLIPKYSDTKAPCVCASGPRHAKEHGKYHAFQQTVEAAYHEEKKSWTYKEARECGASAHAAINSQCSKACTEAQLDGYHKDECKIKDNTELRTDPDAGTRSRGKLDPVEEAQLGEALGEISDAAP